MSRRGLEGLKCLLQLLEVDPDFFDLEWKVSDNLLLMYFTIYYIRLLTTKIPWKRRVITAIIVHQSSRKNISQLCYISLLKDGLEWGGREANQTLSIQ